MRLQHTSYAKMTRRILLLSANRLAIFGVWLGQYRSPRNRPSGQKVATMSTLNIAVAPRQGTTGKSVKTGGHHLAFVGCASFDPKATLKLVSPNNPWRPGTLGDQFYNAVLSKAPATVAAAIELGAKAKTPSYPGGIPAKGQNGVMAHLRWLYTWGGAYLEVGGKLYAPAPVAPKAPKASTKKAS